MFQGQHGIEVSRYTFENILYLYIISLKKTINHQLKKQAILSSD